MAQKRNAAKRLSGYKIALVGTFASMSRSAMEDLIRSHGGDIVASVTRQTSVLLVGQEGWPLRKDGRPSSKLLAARKAQAQGLLTILAENDLLERLGHERPASGSCHLSTHQLSQILKVSCQRIRRWIALGLLHPKETEGYVQYFEYQQVQWGKTLRDFSQAGVSSQRLLKSLERLKEWLPGLAPAPANNTMMERDGELLVRLESGTLADANGQGVFDFFDKPRQPALALAQPNAQDWFERGCKQEAAGTLKEAANSYAEAIACGSTDAVTYFNLGNVLYRLGKKEQAVDCYRQGTQLDPNFAEAWNNLGNVLSELGQPEEAIESLRQALKSDPSYLDAHFSLADELNQLGRQQEARTHWQQYVRHDSQSEWGRFARQQLSKTSR